MSLVGTAGLVSDHSFQRTYAGIRSKECLLHAGQSIAGAVHHWGVCHCRWLADAAMGGPTDSRS